MANLKTKLKNIADAIRSKSGKSGKLSLDGMATEINNLSARDWSEDIYAIFTDKLNSSQSTVKVRRQGNVVMFEADLLATNSLSNRDVIMRFRNIISSEWAKENVKFRGIGEYPTAGGTGYDLVYASIYENSNELGLCDISRYYYRIYINGCFEVVPL